MKGRRGRITGLCAWALALIGCSILSDLLGAATCNECYGFNTGLLIAPVFAIVGVVIGIIALIVSARDAMNRGDRASGMLLILCIALSIGAIVYLDAVSYASVARFYRQIGESYGVVSELLQTYFVASSFGWNILVYAAPAVIALLYARVRDRRILRISALGGLSVLVIAVPLIAAPPWVVLNFPILSVSSESTATSCALGRYGPITVTNAFLGTLRWTATDGNVVPPSPTGIGAPPVVSPNVVTISPSSGSLGPGATQQVTLSGVYAPADGQPNDLTIDFSSNAGPGKWTDRCQLPAPIVFTVSPSSIVADCHNGVYPPITVTNISRSAANWIGSTAEPHVILSPSSGALQAGQSQTVTLTGTPFYRQFYIYFVAGAEMTTVTCSTPSPTTSHP